jgi:uncharacterized lipoprotein YmbA
MKLIALPLFFTLLAGCSLLPPIADEPVRHLLDSSAKEQDPRCSSPVVAIARPSLPPYLERSELVTRVSSGRLSIHENDLWAEPLDAAIARVIAENLRNQTGSTNIQPAGSFISKDYSSIVEIRIDRFDPSSAGVLLLECTWKIQSAEGSGDLTKAFRSEVSFNSQSDPIPNRVKAMNEALENLSKEIAKSL